HTRFSRDWSSDVCSSDLFILTLMVFSAALGDNLLYRLAVYVFVGMSAGYAAVVTWNSVLLPWVRDTLLSGEPVRVVYGAIPLVLDRKSTRLNSSHVKISY